MFKLIKNAIISDSPVSVKSIIDACAEKYYVSVDLENDGTISIFMGERRKQQEDNSSTNVRKEN